MKDEILREVSVYDKKLATLRNEIAALEVTLPKIPEPAVPKFDPEKHPLLKTVTEKVEPVKPVNFNAGDVCEAQWKDKLWYKVKVQTVLGSASDPKYHVRFLDYKDSTLTVGRDSIRPIVNEKKRKAEAAPATPTVASITNSPHVISGPASVNPDALAGKKEGGPDADVPTKRMKIGGHKALERKKGDWKDFLGKGAGKQVAKKESMFRTGTGVNSRGMYHVSHVRRLSHVTKWTMRSASAITDYHSPFPGAQAGVVSIHYDWANVLQLDSLALGLA
jgi:survival-of-motor-neuron-related-splicing factor 30